LAAPGHTDDGLSAFFDGLGFYHQLTSFAMLLRFFLPNPQHENIVIVVAEIQQRSKQSYDGSKGQLELILAN